MGGVTRDEAVTRAAEGSRDPREQACALYRHGLSLQAVGRLVGKSASTVGRWLVEGGVAVRPCGGSRGGGKPRDLGPLIDPVRALYLRGMRIEEIAEQIGESYHLVKRVLKMGGVVLRLGEVKPVPVSPGMIKEVRTLYTEKNMSMTQIAARFAVSMHVIRSALAQAQVSVPAPIRYPNGATELDRRMAQMYRDGMSVRDISKHTGIGRNAVDTALNRAGVIKRSTAGFNGYTKAAAQASTHPGQQPG
jgi:transposase